MVYITKLNEYFEALSINNGKYEKNLENIFDILVENGDITKAIKYAKKLEAEYNKNDTPAMRKPGTTVYALVEELYGYLK